jgi:GMP synthase (glutamine-hydrolysing)
MKDVDGLLANIRSNLVKQVPGKCRAIVAASGGIDSTVAAVIAHEALKERATSLFVDNGLLRAGEVQKTIKLFEEAKIPHRVLNAKDEFLDALKDVLEPEEKRVRIGNTFAHLFEREALSIGAEYLIQGTIAPDWIESGGSVRDTIKTHHNVGGMPKDMSLKVVEPLRDLYKDEVRALAAKLGISTPQRQPFPGPGLAVRIIGEVTEERVDIVRKANLAVEESVEKAVKEGRMAKPWQYFAVLLPLKNTGVMGDNRTYGEAIAVRMVESVDAMTAAATQAPYEVLREISERITREVGDKINRVVYDITDKPPATIEWE